MVLDEELDFKGIEEEDEEESLAERNNAEGDKDKGEYRSLNCLSEV